jgi:hypothetical protein
MVSHVNPVVRSAGRTPMPTMPYKARRGKAPRFRCPAGKLPAVEGRQMSRAAKPKQNMVPIPLRIGFGQMATLRKQADSDGVPVQEHIRRAVDLYVAALARGYTPAVLGNAPAPSPANDAPKQMRVVAR